MPCQCIATLEDLGAVNTSPVGSPMREVGDSVTGASVEFITLEMGSEQLLYLAADYSLGDRVDLGQADNNQGAHLHEIKISYHPASKRPEQRFGINEDPPSASASTGSQLSKADTENLLSIIRRCIESPEQFTLSSHKDLSEYWDLARSMTDSVSKSVRPSFTFPSFK